MTAQRTGAVSVATLSGLILTLVVADVVAPRWMQALGLDVWNLRAAQEDARLISEHAIVVEAERVRLRREVEVSGHIATRLIEERTSLVEAVDELEPILRQRAGFECAWPIDPPPTFRHSVARYIITRVEATLASNPDKCSIVTARLKAEYVALK